MAQPKHSIVDHLRAFCLSHGFLQTYWVAYSGGLDSHVLLHGFARLRTEFPHLKLRAMHVNHQLSPNASSWALHCEKVCAELQVELLQQAIHVATIQGDSLENIARKRRYAVFAEIIEDKDYLVTAHHQDDQAETVLLQLLRGSGLKGLSGMPGIKAFANGYLARPLLHCTRDALQQYATEHQLNWIDDESNANSDFTRNFLRHDILPLLKKRWPQVSGAISRVAEHCAEAQYLLDEVARKNLSAAQGSVDSTLSVKKLLTFSVAEQRCILREWLIQKNIALPSTIKMRHILQDMLHARPDKMPCVMWGNAEMRRYRDDLYVMSTLSAHDATQVIPWDLKQPLVLVGIGVLQPELLQNFSGQVANVTVRFRRGGEKYGHHLLKKKFQEWGVLPWMRDRVPLIYVGQELVVVCVQ